MTYEKGDRVHVKHPSGPEWNGVVCGIITSHTDKRVEIKLESGESVPFAWLTPIKPKIEPQVGDIGYTHTEGYPIIGFLSTIEKNKDDYFYQDSSGLWWKHFTPIARKLKTWEELSDKDWDCAVEILLNKGIAYKDAYDSILALALPGYPEITHARIGEEQE